MRKRGAVLLALLGALTASGASAAESLSDVFERVKTSVVVIRTTQREIQPQSRGQMVSTAGMGSGVLVSSDGRVMTAAHVVQTADRVEVEFLNGDVIAARVVGSEPSADVALLHLELPPPRQARVAELGDSDRVKVGDAVFVVGAPLGITYSLTSGIISARRSPEMMMGEFQLAEFFQTDAAINVGNSGGPLFSMDGKLIGVVSHILSQSGGSDGLGFVVTSNTARALLLESRAIWSGMDGVYLTGEMARAFNVPGPAGLLVQRVAAGSLAARLGLEPGWMEATIEGEPILLGGDILLGAMGVRLADESSDERIRERLGALEKGQPVRVLVLRAGREVELSVPLP
jgi:S1-C subfamily serine protease